MLQTKKMKTVFIALLLIVVGGLVAASLYVRTSKTDLAEFTTIPQVTEPTDSATMNSFLAARDMRVPGPEALDAVRKVALATPRTTLVSGSVEAGKMTFQTRSRVMGFPDYSTVAVEGDLLAIYARSRFGKGDMGVNKDRVQDWLGQLGEVLRPLP